MIRRIRHTLEYLQMIVGQRIEKDATCIPQVAEMNLQACGFHRNQEQKKAHPHQVDIRRKILM